MLCAINCPNFDEFEPEGLIRSNIMSSWVEFIFKKKKIKIKLLNLKSLEGTIQNNFIEIEKKIYIFQGDLCGWPVCFRNISTWLLNVKS